MTTNPISRQNASRSPSSGAAPTTNAQSGGQRERWTGLPRPHPRVESPAAGLTPARAFRVSRGVLLEPVEILRPKNDPRDPPLLDLLDDLAGIVAAYEDHGARQH